MHMGLQLLNVALEAAHIAPYQSLLCLVKDELCRHLIQVNTYSLVVFLDLVLCLCNKYSCCVSLQLLSVDRMNLYTASIRVCFLLFESMREHLKFQLEVI